MPTNMTVTGMTPRLSFIKPEEKNPIDVQFPEYYRRKVKVFENNYLKVNAPDVHDRPQMLHAAYKSVARPEHITTRLVSICRTKIRADRFEDDDSNIIRGSDAPKEGLSYLLHEVIDDPKSIENGNPPGSFPLSTNTFTVGKYSRPTFKFETDQRGNIIKSEPSGAFDCWYIESNTDAIRSILSKFQKDEEHFSMIVSEDNQSQRTVFNETEFIEGDIDDLVAANKGDKWGKCYLTEEYGGLNRYLKDKAAKDKEGQTSVQPEDNNSNVKPKRQYRKPEEDSNNSS